MTLDDFLPNILPFAKGCPAIVANQATRMAIIELCQKSMIWREFQTPVLTVLDQTAYAYAPAANQQVCTLLGLKLDGQDVGIVTPGIGMAWDSAGTTSDYAYGTFTGFELRPARAAGGSIVTYSTVAPSITATTVPDALSQYLEGITQGALARILFAKDKEYSNAAGAGLADQQFKDCIADAKSDAERGFARAKTRTSQVWF